MKSHGVDGQPFPFIIGPLIHFELSFVCQVDNGFLQSQGVTSMLPES